MRPRAGHLLRSRSLRLLFFTPRCGTIAARPDRRHTRRRPLMTDPATPRPTHVHYWIVLIAMSAAVLLYLERVCLSVADVYVREDLRIGKAEMDLAFAAFFLAYAAGQVPSGWLSQRYGPRLMMTLYMIGWSVFGVFIAVAQDFTTLVAARFLLGLSQAGAYPTAALLVKRWVPDRSRGTASGIVAFGGRFGGAGANWLTGILIVAFVPLSVPATVKPTELLNAQPIVAPTDDQLHDQASATHLASVREAVRRNLPPDASPDAVVEAVNAFIRTPLSADALDWNAVKLPRDGQKILERPVGKRTEAETERLNRLVVEKAFPGAIRQLHVAGWRPTLLLYGVAGVVVGLLFWMVARNWPREHPWANAAEVAWIESGQVKAAQTSGTDAIPWRELATSGNQWLYSAGQFFSNVGWVFLISLMPRFLDERFAVPVDQRGLMTTIPLFVAALALPVGGWLTDRLTRVYGRRAGRAIPMGVLKLPCAVLLAACPWLPDAWSVVAALTLMSALQDFGIPSTWAFAQDTGGKQVGAVLGWANMWGNLGAGLAIITTGRVAELLGWDAAFLMIAVAFVLCGISGSLANATVPVFRDETEGGRGE